ncbi:MAG: laccase domain-containing protein [Actinomycetota bacterium]|mgnify:CR=1 FL=1
MIRPLPGVMFGAAEDGDARRDDEVKRRLSAALGVSPDWAWMRQVHGTTVIRATEPGTLGDADAAFTTVPGLPLAVGTADCFPVVLTGDGVVGVAHAGWRGAAEGVVRALRAAMTTAGHPPTSGAIGPGIGSCCFEVGPDVLERFPRSEAITSWGTPGVNLRSAILDDMTGLEVWVDGRCTMSDEGFHSYRKTKTTERQVTVVWIPD